MISLQFWYEFASTYSYPAAMCVEKRATSRGVSIVWRPFLLGPIFAAQNWTTSPFNIYPAKGRYMWRDLERICAKEGLAFRRPEPFPQNTLLAARIATVLNDEERRRFTRAAYEAEFALGESIEAADDIARVLERCGIPQSALDAAGDAPAKDMLRSNVEEAICRGIFGAPSFVTDDEELFWGFDRLEEALDWAVAWA